MTTALIKDSNTVLNGQIASESALRNFATELSGFSTVLAGSDPDLRRLIETGSTSTIELRDFIETNRVELGSLFNNLVTTGNIIVRHLDGIKQVLVVYPYVVEGGFTVVSKSPDTGLYDAHFGLIITDTAPCENGYGGTDRRKPSDGRNRPMNEDARCTDGPRPEQPAWRPERPAPRGARLRRPGRRLVRPDHRSLHLGRRPLGPGVDRYRGPADARRGVVEVAVPPAPDLRSGVNSEDTTPHDAQQPAARTA